MKNRIATICIGVWMMFFLWPASLSASWFLGGHTGISPDTTVYYHLAVDTMGVDLGFLAFDPENSTGLIVSDTKDDRSLWRITFIPLITTGPNNYYLINKHSGDSLAFNVPQAVDTLTKAVQQGEVSRWDDLFNRLGERDSLKTIIPGTSGDGFLLLTYHEGEVYLSQNSTNQTALTFVIERHKDRPDESARAFYQLKIDTLGAPDVPTTGFLYADTSRRSLGKSDSLIVMNQIDPETDSLSFWRFETDTILSDTLYLKIYNKETDSLLAFDIPTNDTLAVPTHLGALNRWRMPFFAEDNRISRFVTRDTLTDTDYYLAMTPDSVIMLVTDTLAVKPLFFTFVGNEPTPPEEEKPDSSIVDTAHVYRIRRVMDSIPGPRYIGSNEQGDEILLDTVYAHLPDGQFVVDRNNRFSLVNRLYMGIKTDSLFALINAEGVKIQDWYCHYDRVNDVRDTFEIREIDYAGMDDLKQDPHLSYKYMSPADLAAYLYVFSFQSAAPADSLNNRILGHDLDSVMTLLPLGDTISFILEQTNTVQLGAFAIGDIPRVERPVYLLRSSEDTTLYMSASSPMRTDPFAKRDSFFLKTDTIPSSGKYYFVDFNGRSITNKVLVNDEKRLNPALIDSVDTHLFAIETKVRYMEEPDGYDYLKSLTEIEEDKEVGFYEFRIPDPWESIKWLTMNNDRYAVLAKEGESMLRAGSYTPDDLHLWVDTARGPGFNPEKPSFYIVYGVDTTAAGFDGFHVSGHFLHVMDSTSLADFDDYVVYNADSSVWYNRANFVSATRMSANELKLGNEVTIGENNPAANEYRFYLQEADEAGKYHIVTEAGYGDGGRSNVRGYLSVKDVQGKAVICFGPREDAAKVTFSSSTVANEVIVIPPIVEEIDRSVVIVGQAGQVHIRNAAGQEAMIYNVLGQAVVKKTLSSDNESIPVSRGILIVKVGTKTQKVVVK